MLQHAQLRNLAPFSVRLRLRSRYKLRSLSLRPRSMSKFRLEHAASVFTVVSRQALQSLCKR
jgi:hypothetical protein